MLLIAVKDDSDGPKAVREPREMSQEQASQVPGGAATHPEWLIVKWIVPSASSGHSIGVHPDVSQPRGVTSSCLEGGSEPTRTCTNGSATGSSLKNLGIRRYQNHREVEAHRS